MSGQHRAFAPQTLSELVNDSFLNTIPRPVGGQPTQAFTPEWTQPQPRPCRCDDCKYGQRPGADAVLYTGADAVYLLERAAIRDGRYEDAQAFGTKVHLGRMADFDAHHEHVRQTLSRGARQIAQIRGAS